MRRIRRYGCQQSSPRKIYAVTCIVVNNGEALSSIGITALFPLAEPAFVPSGSVLLPDPQLQSITARSMWMGIRAED